MTNTLNLICVLDKLFFFLLMAASVAVVGAVVYVAISIVRSVTGKGNA